MPAGLNATDPAFAVATWNALPEEQRNVDVLNRQLADLGFAPVAKASLYRWLKQPVKIAEKAVKKTIKLAERVEKATTSSAADYAHLDLKGIPDELVEALGIRVLLIAKGEGHDKLEQAIVLVATAIAQEAPQIAKQLLMAETETVDADGLKTIKRPADAAKNAIQALAVCADSLHKITASRTLPSLAHRNYGEGDRLMGEGDRARAEAETTRQSARADNARVINQPGGFEDQETEDEALAALRDAEHK